MPDSVYKLLAEKLAEDLGRVEYCDWDEIIKYLSDEGYLDYDILKELLGD